MHFSNNTAPLWIDNKLKGKRVHKSDLMKMQYTVCITTNRINSMEKLFIKKKKNNT